MKQHLKRILIILIFSLIGPFMWGQSIAMVPLLINGDESQLYSGESISQSIVRGNLFIAYTKGRAAPISTLLDASSFCEREGIENLIYGFFRREDKGISIELRFYNHEQRNIRTVFFGSDHMDHSGRLIANIKSKIEIYLSEELFLFEIIDDEVHKGMISVPISAGYWVPLDGSWNNLTVTLFSLSSGIMLNPFEHIIKTENMTLNFHFGAILLYEAAINNPDYETFFLSKIKILIPGELSLSLLEKHRISLAIAPLYQLDILAKKRSYADETVEAMSGFGFSTDLSYHYNFSELFSAGVSMNFDFVFYENPQINFRPELSFLIHTESVVKGAK